MNNFYEGGRGMSFWRRGYLMVITICLLIITVSGSAFGKAATVENRIKPLTIGDTIPDELWNKYFPVVSTESDQVQYLSLGDYKDKLIILDFWATWCAPCVAMIPKIDSLQQRFGEDVQFLSVTTQKGEDVLQFIEILENKHSKKYRSPMLTDDYYLTSLFLHNILPHYVWILDGKVFNMTDSKGLSNSLIINALRREKHLGNSKVDKVALPYNKLEPLLLRCNGDSNTSFSIFHSLFTGYIPGLIPAGYDIQNIQRDSTIKVTFRNVSIDWFYRLAYGNGKRFINPARIIYEVKNLDKIIWNESLGVSYNDWKEEGNAYSYELIMPNSVGSKIYELMQQDFSRYIPYYEAKLIPVNRLCYVLKRTSNEDKLKSLGGEEVLKINKYECVMKNVYLNRLIEQFDSFYFQNSDKPILNETDYTDRVDLEFQGDLTNIDSINKGLEPYDLRFFEAEREVETLVISDRK